MNHTIQKSLCITAAIVSLLAINLTGCASGPESRPLPASVSRTIHISSDQKILHYNRDPRAYYLFPQGAYRLIKEDDEAWYYANAAEEFRHKYLQPEGPMRGGIGYSKWSGNYFIYTAVDLDVARRGARSYGGEIAGLLVKSSTGDGVMRVRVTWVRPEFVEHWRLK